MSTLEAEVAELKACVAVLESKVQQFTGAEPQGTMIKDAHPMTQEQIVAWLKSRGLISEPSPETLRLAAEWESLPEEEKNSTRWELDHLSPGPMISDIVIENRR